MRIEASIERTLPILGLPPSGEGDDHIGFTSFSSRNRRAASSPFIRGMPMSRNATSGANSWAF